MADFWPACGHRTFAEDGQGRLRPTDASWRWFLARPELAPVAESCAAERALHAALLAQPTLAVAPAQLAALADADARDNLAVFLHYRDTLCAAGTVEACYLGLFRGDVDIPPRLVDGLAQLIVRHLLDGCDDALEARAAELLFRPQRIARHDGRVLAGDRDTLDRRQAGRGLGAIGELLAQAQVPLRSLASPVLAADNAPRYWADAAADRHTLLLDLTHEIARDAGHGLLFRLAPAHSGLQALARVLQRWVAHLLGVEVTIEPLARIADDAWRWHVGLDVEASALLDDLYTGRPVDDARRARVLALFRLRFADPAAMRADVAGLPVYLAMSHDAEGVLRLKPQNLLVNLPLRSLS